MLIKDFKVIFSDKKMLVLLTALIIICAVGAFLCKNEENGPAVRIGIVDEDNTEYSALLVTYFDENEVFSSYMSVVRGSEEEVAQKFQKGEVDLYVVIPSGFTENLIHIENMPIKAVINSSDKTKSVLFRNLLESYSDYIVSTEINCQALYEIMKQEGFSKERVNDTNVRISYDLVFNALGKDSFFERNEIERFDGISLINYFVYSALILIILYGGLLTGLSFLRERMGQADRRLKSAGVSGTRIFLSKYLAFSICYIVLMLLCVVIMVVCGELELPVKAVFFMVAGILASNAVFMLISLKISSVSGYMVLCNMLILLTTIAGGGIIPIMYMPDAMVSVAHFTPTYWFIRLVIM